RMTFFRPTARMDSSVEKSGFNRIIETVLKGSSLWFGSVFKLAFFIEPHYLKPITKKIKMKKTILTIVFAITGVIAFAQEDAADCKDSPLFSRMPNYAIPACSHNYNQ